MGLFSRRTAKIERLNQIGVQWLANCCFLRSSEERKREGVASFREERNLPNNS